MKNRIVVGVTGASGAIYGWRLLEKLRAHSHVEIHLILSRPGEKTSQLEIGKILLDWKALAHYTYSNADIECRLASGSFPTSAMLVAPCSINTMSAIACGASSNLVVRAADVTLKERRRLVLMVRESPFHLGHLRSMVSLSEMGAIIAPPVPAFYQNPSTISQLVDNSVDRVLDLVGLSSPDTARWDDIADDEETDGDEN